jgi:hypothetical protein
MEVTQEQIDELRRIADAATPGPWSTTWAGDTLSGPADARNLPHGYPEDAAFIAAARTALPESLEEIERLRAEVEAMRPVVELTRFLRDACSGDYHTALERLFAASRNLDAALAGKGG